MSALFVMLLLLEAGPGARPWADGVSAERQARALRVYQEGNAEFEQSRPVVALAKYREALADWDHPGIRYNAAVCLLELDQPLQAWEALREAMRYGEAPFDPETWKQAVIYQRLLRGQVVELTVRSPTAGAQLTLDGEPLFQGPGEVTRWVNPGHHVVVGVGAGLASETRALELEGGKSHLEVVPVLPPVRPPVVLAYRWPVWVPWTVGGAGALFLVVAGSLTASAQATSSGFDRDLAQLCPTGCSDSQLPSSLKGAYTSAHAQSVTADVFWVAGGLALGTGVVMLILNQPREVSAVEVTPVVGPGVVGVQGRF